MDYYGTMIVAVAFAMFWASCFVLVHTYFLYPLSLWVASQFVSDDEERTETVPSVALIIAAYNEEDVIAEKIENSLELEYPDEKLSIVVFSDASEDRTDDIVREYQDQAVELVRIEGRVGKTACQNAVVEQVDADVLVFSDADSMYESVALKKLVAHFQSDVGCVVGQLRYRESSEVEGESVYWRYESAIKRLESRVNSLVTGNGAIYAIRADSYIPLSREAISDFAEPLEIVRNGEKVMYADEAIAWERTDRSTQSEFSRRIRIVTRSWNAVTDFPDLLNPLRRPLFAFQLWSHKVFRWLSPVFLFLLLVASTALVSSGESVFYNLALTGQVGFYMLAFLGAIADRMGIDDPIVTHVPYYFVRSNYGMLVGLWQFVRGRNVVVWDTSARSSRESER